MGWAVFSFYPIAVFPVVEAPRWKKGFAVDLCFVFMTWAVFSVGIYLHRRDRHKAERLRLLDEEDKLGQETSHVEAQPKDKET